MYLNLNVTFINYPDVFVCKSLNNNNTILQVCNRIIKSFQQPEAENIYKEEIMK